MSVSGAKSIDSSAAPRTDFDRTRTTPEHDADGLLDRPGDGDLDVLDRQAGRLGDDDDPREGDLGVDAAGHAEHRDDAEGGQQARGQDDQPEVRPGPGDEIDPAAGGPGGARSPAPGSGSSVGLRLGHGLGLRSASPACPSGRLYPPSTITGSPSFRSVPETATQPPCGVPTSGWSATAFPSRTTFRTGPSPRSRIAAAGTWRTSLPSSTVIDTRIDSPEGEPPLRVVHQDADRQVAGLRVGHPAHERDLAGQPLLLGGRGVRRSAAGVRGPDPGGLPDVHRRRPSGSGARTTRRPAAYRPPRRSGCRWRSSGRGGRSGCRARRRSVRGSCG